MNNDQYLVVTSKPWNINAFNDLIKHFEGKWHLITDSDNLTVDKILKLQPKYIFFPHWSELVPDEILNLSTCICFHETDLPFGRGGSPIQNLIANGYKSTYITAIKMTSKIDSGPIYLKKKLSLEGLAEEIYIRASKIVAQMISSIINDDITPHRQTGDVSYFKRRNPNQSEVPKNIDSVEDLFNHIRMLDAESYPRAFIVSNGFKFEITRPSLKSHELLADIRITKLKKETED